MATCPVNHDERRNMGLLQCYMCNDILQSIEEANAVRLKIGKKDFYGSDRILRDKPMMACPLCGGSGRIDAPRDQEEEQADERL